LHGFIDGGQLSARCVDDTAWRPRSPGGRQAGIGFGNQPRDLGHVAFDLAAELRPRFGGFPGGVLGVLAAVERLVEGLPVVALRHGILRAFEGVGRRRELTGGVPICAGGSRRVDRTLGLIHLLVGRVGTGHEKDCGRDACRKPERHEDLSIAP